MTVSKTLYKSFYWKALQFFISFLVNIVFARIFQSAISAEFYSFIYLLSFAVSFFTLGLDIGLNYYIARGEMATAQANIIIVMVLLLGLLVSVPLLSLFYQPARYPHISLQAFAVFSCLQIAGGLLTVLSGTVFTAHEQNHRAAMISFYAGCGVLVAGIIASRAATGTMVVKLLFSIYFLFYYLQGCIMFAYSQWLYGGGQLFRMVPFSQLKKILGFSFYAFVTNFIFFAGIRLSLVIAPYWMEPAALGNYVQVFRIIEYINVLVAFIYYPFITIVTRRGDDTRPMVLLLVRLSNSFVLLIVILLLAGGRWLFPFVFGKSFSGMYMIFAWFIPGLFASCASVFFTGYFFGAGKIKYNFTSACILIGSMCLSIFAAKPWGVCGVAFAFSLASIASLLYDMIVFHRLSKFRLQEVLFITRTDLYKLVAVTGWKGRI